MQIVSYGDNLHVMSKPVLWRQFACNVKTCFLGKIRKISSLLLEKKLQNFSNNASEVLPIKENLSNLLELASDGNCSLLFEEINKHLAS